MVDDIIINKIDIINRCIKRINEEYKGDFSNLNNYTIQDSIILNILRACEASIDLAMHIISEKKLGVPKTTKECYIILKENKIINENLCNKMVAMIGFRNIAVHDYKKINLEIIKNIIENNLKDLEEFYNIILKI